jgi:SAM-dependent methyltransferase
VALGDLQQLEALMSVVFDQAHAGTEDVKGHFTNRAPKYNRSSHWVDDDVLAARVLALTEPCAADRMLDVACGTGLVAKHFKGTVGQLTGFDLTPAMFDQARPHVDRLVEGAAEDLPFGAGVFSLVTCRQGIQFMDDSAAVAEIFRVLEPGGRVCLIHLCAYGEADREAYFEILRLRNAARRNFYLREDLAALLDGAGFVDVTVHDHISVEDVDIWSDHGAMDEARREAIREVYRRAGPDFQVLHHVEDQGSGRFLDHMLFGVAVGCKPS